ncbi:MAG TPA: DUF4404 family protein [Caldimonas sp.]|nr:DUF4404 family protein [Caldimonas sp.]
MTHLDESLNHLLLEIKSLDLGDEQARERVERLVRDIEKLLESPKTTRAQATLGEQLRASVLSFEVSHPRLAAVMNEVLEQLSNMGI